MDQVTRVRGDIRGPLDRTEWQSGEAYTPPSELNASTLNSLNAFVQSQSGEF